MASVLINLAAILSLTLPLLLSFSRPHVALLTGAAEDEDGGFYVLDDPAPNLHSRSRFLASVIKKGTSCDPVTNNVCDGISANNGTSILRCCKTHCRNVLGDRNNCGACGQKCKLGELCCSGACINIAYSEDNCGKCNSKCLPGLKCQYGTCGYA
ncbi:protein GRIM REAPER [Rhodamnia argentea]|uniref:Protein GRIM REAPER n=1 Tax=Rhodamnia argentea TaxID=178133 RepID=A0A8B8MM47_9MYRT|nr:protein GRIM REAPER [Rhodamnia argentea]